MDRDDLETRLKALFQVQREKQSLLACGEDSDVAETSEATRVHWNFKLKIEACGRAGGCGWVRGWGGREGGIGARR
jgi:hypothetical protein